MSESKVYKKRPHRKVKSGCSTCKRRKIKCDEGRPRCSNCARYSAECFYPPPDSLTPGSTSTSTTPPLVQTPESIVDDPPVRQRLSSHELPMRDIALMHQWCTSTCYGFGDDFRESFEPWRDALPLIGQRYPFLMRGILSMSAVHLAKLSSDPSTSHKYLQLAAYHQDLALPEYRLALLDVTEDSSAAMVAFSAITATYALTSPKEPGMFFAYGALEWISLVRGFSGIPPHWRIWIERGPLADTVRRWKLPSVDPALCPDDYRLSRLHGLFSNLPQDEQVHALHYEGALQWLRQAFAYTFSHEHRLGHKYAVIYWLEHVAQDFIDLLSQKKPCAFVLLAHCCVLVKRAPMVWFFQGAAERMLTEMKPYLGPTYTTWIEWPLEECGML